MRPPTRNAKDTPAATSVHVAPETSSAPAAAPRSISRHHDHFQDPWLTAALLGEADGVPDSPHAPLASNLPSDDGIQHAGPDGHEHGAEVGASHDHAADRVAEILAEPDPIAGVGDPGKALDLLADLAMPELLDTLVALRQRGLLASIEGAAGFEQATRVRAAAHALAVAQLAPEQATPATLEPLASDLDGLTPGEQHAVFSYLIAQRRGAPELHALLEGIIALEGAAVGRAEAVGESEAAGSGSPGSGVAAGVTGAGGMPEPIEPGPWRRPGDQPAPLYIGNQAHTWIAEHYMEMHPGEKITSNHTPIASILERLHELGQQPQASALSGSELALRPDILNLTRLCLYEIKPEAALAAGAAQAALYVGILANAGIAVSLGPSLDPGTRGQLPAPGGVFLFWSPLPGVITYRYRRGRLVPVPVAVPQEQTQEQASRAPWAWQLEPLTAEQQALVTTMVTTTMMILMAILLLPVSS